MPFGNDEALRIRDFPFFIGRHDSEVLNDLPIHDLQPWEVSRRHAHLVLREGRVGVMDLGSRHGTWVDDRQLGGPTTDPGPAFFPPHGGKLTLGRRGRSPYVFDVRHGAALFAMPVREAEPLPA